MSSSNSTWSQTFKAVKDHGIQTLVITGLVLAVSFVARIIQKEAGILVMLVSLTFVLGLFLVVTVMIRIPILAIIESKLANLTQLENAHNKRWLLNTEGLADYEKRLDKKSVSQIWLVSSDLEDDSQEGPFFEIVRHNLKRKKIPHIYFAPNRNRIKSVYTNIRNLHGKDENLKIVYLPDDFFFLVPELDIVIYNPLGEGTMEKKAYMGIPTKNLDNHYHADVSNIFIDTLVGHLLEHYESQIINP